MHEQQSPQTPSKAAKTGGDPANGWDAKSTSLLEVWGLRMNAAEHAYYAKAERLRVWNYLLGIPVVIATTIVGTSVFATLARNSNEQLPASTRFLVGTISVLAAVLASIQTFMKLGESAQQHGASGDWYAAIRREIEQILTMPVALRPPAKKCFNDLRKEMNRAAQKAPELGERWLAAYQQRFDDKNPSSVAYKRPWFLRTPVGAASSPSQRDGAP